MNDVNDIGGVSVRDRIASLSPEQRALFERLRDQKKKPSAPRGHRPPPIPRRGLGDHWPLSFDQERLWFLYTLDPLATAYNIDTASRIRGRLDLAALSRAFQEIPRRHEIWRTSFRVIEGRPAQVISPAIVLPSPIVDLCALPAELRELTAHELIVRETRRPFVLETGPLARALFLRLDDQDHICQLTVHHIVTDWVTFQLFWYELGALYEAYTAGRPSPLPELPVQYADFTVWQRSWLQGEVLDTYRDYWLERLAGAPLILDLPTDRPRPAVQTSRGHREPVRVERSAELKGLARREGLTPFMAVLAVYQILLARHAGQETLIVGSPNANRNREEIEPAFGFFLTQLAFCTDLGGDPTLREALRRVRDVALGAYSHQELPFGKLVEALQPERDLSRAPIIQAVLLLLDGSVLNQKLADLHLEPMDIPDGNARYDVMFALWDQPDQITGWYEYNADLWDATTVSRLLAGFGLLVETLLADPDMRLSDVPVLSPAARHQLLVEWNDTAVPPALPTALGLFLARAAERPEAAALVDRDRIVTYCDLDRRAEHLAARLRAAGAGPGARVGVCLERSPDLVTALLAVWKAGAAYVPLDPAHPAERRDFVLADCGAAVLLSGSGDGEITALAPGCGMRGEPLPDTPAYAIYTSGSTGRPKGVEVPHSALSNLLRDLASRYSSGPDAVWTAVTTVAFDIAALEIFLPLTTGARVVLADRETAADGELLARALETSGTTHLQATPAAWRQLLDSGWQGRPGLRRLCGGEALSADLAARLLALDGRSPLWNQYGPTETTIWSTVHRVEQGGPSAAPVPLGRPLANTRVHLLDRALRPVPLGSTGELFLGGAGVARGYLGQPDLTAERFLPDPLSGEPGERLYRTGDLARRLADGVLEFLGRSDHQVKLRGFRIELGEIEASLRRHPAVADAVVLLRELRMGDSRLTAYLTVEGAASSPAPAELRAALREQLPEYMLPSDFVTLDALPLTPNGKVDRKALARLGPADPVAAGAGEAPRDATERLLADLWREVLGTAPAGIDDDFFTLGGHSLLATQLTLRIREAFGVDLPVRSVFQATTVKAQAALVSRPGHPVTLVTPLLPLTRDGYPFKTALSFAQERLWFIDRLTPGSAAYIMPLALRLRGALDPVALEHAFAELARRHETLRTSFSEEAGRPVQVIAPPAAWRLPVEDAEEDDVLRLAVRDASLSFDLGRGPLLRARLLRLGPAEHVLLLSLHHIISDLWSMGVLVRDMAALYAGAFLPPLPVQYADFAVWQRACLQGEDLERQIAFWRDRLDGSPPALDLPTDRPRPATQSVRGASLPFSAKPGSARALGELGRRHGATLFMVVTTALASVLARFTGQDDLVLGSPIANRQRSEIAGLIGMFVNTLALRIDLRGDLRGPSFLGALGRVRETALDAFAHQDVPFEKLVEALQPRRDPSRHPLFQVVLAMQNVPLGAVELPGLELEPLEVESTASKFDLTLSLYDSGGDLTGRVEYAADLFDRATVERFLGHLGHLFTAVTAEPGTPLSELPLMGAEEERQLLQVGRVPSGRSWALPATVHELFSQQAGRTPDQTAAMGPLGVLTYGALLERSCALASRIRSVLPRPLDRPVALLAAGSGADPLVLAGMLGILQAGAGFVPLDPRHPKERLAWILADGGCEVLVAPRRYLEHAAGLGPRHILCLEDAIPSGPEAATPVESEPRSLAYIVYTSGSTGRPKGVQISHESLVPMLLWGIDYFGLGASSRVLQNLSFSFDFGIFEHLTTLLAGGMLVFPGKSPGEAAGDPLTCAREIVRHGIDTLHTTPAFARELAAARPQGVVELASLEILHLGGEALSRDTVTRLREAAPRAMIYNGYGPTEATVNSSIFRIGEPESLLRSTVPIGRPSADNALYILDRTGRPVPFGAHGDLHVGGIGVARGYLNRPDLTADRFVPDPFGSAPGGRLYRTGDLARYLPGGLPGADIEFLGRTGTDDGQVKIRGFRVEIGEVEAVLAAHPAVRQAAVLASDEGRAKELAACVVPADPAAPPAVAELQRFLRGRLPESMVPSSWSFLGALPLTANGKVDRRELRGLARPAARLGVERMAPRTPLEEHLVEACAVTLDLDPEKVGVLDNFFDLGGHSLLATQLVAQLLNRWDLTVPLQLLFDARTLADLAERITERELSDADPELLAEMMAELRPDLRNAE